MDYSLSEDDIRFLLKDKVKVLTYKDMYKSTTIDKLLSPYNCVVLLYEIYPNHGHWTLLYKMRKHISYC